MIVIYDVVFVQLASGTGPAYLIVSGQDGIERRHRLAHRVKEGPSLLAPNGPDIAEEFFRGVADLKQSMGAPLIHLLWYCQNCRQYQMALAERDHTPTCSACRHQEGWYDVLSSVLQRAYSLRSAFDYIDGTHGDWSLNGQLTRTLDAATIDEP